MGNQVLGICRLCLTENSLLVDSHIIPKFQYRSIKEENGKYLILTDDPNEKQKSGQKGITEHLLCAKCDNGRLQINEDHLARVMYKELPGRNFPTHIEIYGYDYKRLKNALLSILWRMSITTRPMFKNVHLSESHDEKIRKALLNDIEFHETEYPITVTVPFFEGQFLSDIILSPHAVDIQGDQVYSCIISGLLFTFVIGSIPERTLDSLFLRKDHWKMLKMDGKKIPFLWDAYLKLAQAMRRRESSRF